MKINKEMLDRLASMSDAELWGQIRAIAGSHGLKIPDGIPPHAEMEKLRSMMRGETKMSLGEAVKIINNQKREKNR